MYCTLQEAYSIPSFDPASKGSKRNSRSCGVPKNQPIQPADPFDAYNADTGRELAAAAPSYGREDFTNPVEKVSYAALANDYKYYCDTYGVCTNQSQPVKEGFENPTSKTSTSLRKPQSSATPRKQQGSCGPLQPPPYEYPMSEMDKKRYNVALNDALKQEQTATVPAKYEARRVDMNKVSGYYDEDLELYLQTKDMKASPALKELPKADLKAEPYDPAESPFANAIQKFGGQPMGGPYAPVVQERMANVSSSARTDKIGMWMDMLLFVLLGVLVIFLCDQLVKLGMMLGMKSTVNSLSAIIAQLEKA